MTCCHRWLCEEPNGPLAREECRLCGEVRYSHNVYLPDRSSIASRQWRTLPRTTTKLTLEQKRAKRQVAPGEFKHFPFTDVPRGMA